MTETARSESWNDIVIQQFREGRERVADMFDLPMLLLLHSTGARSGQPRTSPLVFFSFDDDLVIVASAGGAPAHPAWYHNLLAHPRVTIERWQDGAIETLDVEAVETSGEDRDRLWESLKAAAPGFAEYEVRTTRQIPVLRLKRR